MSIVKNITSEDNLDWREIVINWEGMGDDVTEIKAGTPMDAEGNIANNGNCFGLMMGDVLRTRSRARVVISGPVDLDEAEANSGITLTDEAKAAMRDVWFPGKSGGGLPTGGAPYQQLVTDGEGNAKWEGRLAYETLGEKRILAETTLNFADKGNGFKYSELTENLEIQAGDTVTVIWDGAPYTCIAFEVDGAIAFGNSGLISYGEDTGEPFIWLFQNGIWVAATTESSDTHVAAISGYGIIVKKLDAKYLDTSNISALVELPHEKWTYEYAKKILDRGHIPYIRVSLDYDAFILFPCQDTTDMGSTNVFISFASLVGCHLMDEWDVAHVAYFKLVSGASPAENGMPKVYDLPKGNRGKSIIVGSSTSGSTKKFRITVDDSGTISATEVTV